MVWINQKIPESVLYVPVTEEMSAPHLLCQFITASASKLFLNIGFTSDF